MKLTLAIPMTDLFAVKKILPSIADAAMENFIKKELKDFDKSKEKNGLKVKTSFNIIQGFKLEIEGEASAIIEQIEYQMKLDLRTILEGYVSATMMMISTTKSAEEAYKLRNPKEEVSGEQAN